MRCSSDAALISGVELSKLSYIDGLLSYWFCNVKHGFRQGRWPSFLAENLTRVYIISVSKFKIRLHCLENACERLTERFPGGPPCDARAPHLYPGPGQSLLLPDLHCGIFRQHFRHDHRVWFQAHAEPDELFLREPVCDRHAYFTGVYAFSNGRPVRQGSMVLRGVYV